MFDSKKEAHKKAFADLQKAVDEHNKAAEAYRLAGKAEMDKADLAYVQAQEAYQKAHREYTRGVIK